MNPVMLLGLFLVIPAGIAAVIFDQWGDPRNGWIACGVVLLGSMLLILGSKL